MYKGPKQLEIVDMPQPIPQRDELLIKVKACGICGSDVHGYLGITGRRIAPMIMGHEFSGEVVGLGENVRLGYKVGDRVAIQPCVSCWECVKCKEGYNNVCENRNFMGAMDYNGAMVEYICVPEKQVYRLPQDMSYSVGALIEALAVAYSGVKKAGNLEGKNVVIIGGGTIGQLVLMCAKVQRPKKIILSDLSDNRLSIANTLGADVTINPRGKDFSEEVYKAFDGEKADVSIEAVGIGATVSQALDSLKSQGTCVLIGNSAKVIEVNMQQIVTRELKIYGSYLYTHEEFGETIDFIHNNNLDLSTLISKEISLEDAPQMFEALTTQTDKYLKCIIKF
jgi:2-desacetyl-2-hydroxyethyl bacteriochlorophyllide A dehydrogenase